MVGVDIAPWPRIQLLYTLAIAFDQICSSVLPFTSNILPEKLINIQLLSTNDDLAGTKDYVSFNRGAATKSILKGKSQIIILPKPDAKLKWTTEQSSRKTFEWSILNKLSNKYYNLYNYLL